MNGLLGRGRRFGNSTSFAQGSPPAFMEQIREKYTRLSEIGLFYGIDMTDFFQFSSSVVETLIFSALVSYWEFEFLRSNVLGCSAIFEACISSFY